MKYIKLLILFFLFTEAKTQELCLPFGLDKQTLLENDTLENYNLFSSDSMGNKVKNGKWKYTDIFLSINTTKYYIGEYIAGKKQGKWCECIHTFSKNNPFYISKIYYYKDDYLNGSYTCYSEKGIPTMSCFFKDGLLDGSVSIFDKNRRLTALFAFFNDKLEQSLYIYKQDDMVDFIQQKGYPFIRLTNSLGCQFLNIPMLDENEPMNKKCK